MTTWIEIPARDVVVGQRVLLAGVEVVVRDVICAPRHVGFRLSDGRFWAAFSDDLFSVPAPEPSP